MSTLLSTVQVAKKTGFSHDYIRRLCLRGVIKSVKIGRMWLIEEKDIYNLKRRKHFRYEKNKDLT